MKEQGVDVKIISDRRGMKVFKGFFPELLVESYPFRGWKFFLNFYGFLQSIIYILKYKPDFVISFGGYPTFPPMVAALLMGIPLFIMEANSIPGKVTRIFARFAKLTFFGLPPFKIFKYPHKITGLPIRRSITSIKGSREPRFILIAGGSLGAESLINLAHKLAINFRDEKFLLIKGRREYRGIIPKNLKVIDFSEEISGVYKYTKLCITRCGASFLSEILYLEIPSIVIPYPQSADSHQYYNGLVFERTGLGVMVEDRDMEKVSSILEYMLKNMDNYKIRENILKANPSEEIFKEVKKHVR